MIMLLPVASSRNIFLHGMFLVLISCHLLNISVADDAEKIVPKWDDKGYIMFCPCMGRFGNQAEHYVGALAFAKAVDRTLVLPPFRTYVNVPLSDWFQIEPFHQFHRVITMEDFMAYFGDTKWPPGKRRGYCWLPPNSEHQCEMKNGNPFGPFWDGFHIDFDEYIKFDLSNQADITNEKRMAQQKSQWDERYPVSEHPVIAFRGAPAAFPMAAGNRQIQKYFKWNTELFAKAEDEMTRLFHGERFVGIHLRTGPDWVSSCNHAENTQSFMASSQCLSRGEKVFRGMCYPEVEEIVQQTTEAVKKYSARHLYIATDKLSYLTELSEALEPLQVKVHHLDPHLPQMDLMILGQSDFFIGNCVSSFTSFVKRERDVNDRPSTFWGFPVGG